MSRYGGPRRSGDDLAYGELPQRWDRDRFERLGGGGPPSRYEEDYRYTERDRPGRQDIMVTDRIDERGPNGRYEERDRYVEHDRFTPGGRRKRTDKELFGDVDPRELANMALTPYRKQSITREDIDIDRRSQAGPRPGLLRRQSSLDTFDRRPIPRYERETIRIPTYAPAPLPIPREGEYEERIRYRDYEPEAYREVEIQRERSVHRRAGPKSVKSAKSSKTKSSRRSSSSSSSSDTVQESVHESRHRRGGSVHESFHESYHGGEQSIHESFHASIHGGGSSVSESIQQTEKKFKKGKTRMPKRLVRREAIMDLGYPFDEEEDFFVLRIALEKEQIDEVMRISETYKNGEKKTVYKYDERIEEAPFAPPREHEEVQRTEWINPPTVVFENQRSASRSEHHGRNPSPSEASTVHQARSNHRSRSHRRSEPGEAFFEERRTVFDERSAPPPPLPSYPPPPQFYEERKTVVEERESNLSPTHQIRSPSQHHGGTLVLQEREYRSDRDIQSEIARLEAERRAIRLEREAEEKRNMAVRIRERPDEEFQLVEYRERRPTREVLEVVEREKSPPRNVTRVEKDRKEKRKAKIVAAAMATLT